MMEKQCELRLLLFGDFLRNYDKNGQCNATFSTLPTYFVPVCKQYRII